MLSLVYCWLCGSHVQFTLCSFRENLHVGMFYYTSLVKKSWSSDLYSNPTRSTLSIGRCSLSHSQLNGCQTISKGPLLWFSSDPGAFDKMDVWLCKITAFQFERFIISWAPFFLKNHSLLWLFVVYCKSCKLAWSWIVATCYINHRQRMKMSIYSWGLIDGMKRNY